jgi:hypothetical protein
VTLTADEVHAPPARGDDGRWHALRATPHGRLFRKHVLSYGSLVHPKTGERITIDAEFVDQLKANFARRVTGPVPLQLADAQNRHNEDPALTVGEVVGIEDDGTRVHVLLDVRRRADDLGRTLLACSACFHPDFADMTTLRRIGPALRHVLITNRPYLVELDEYEELAPPVELSAPSTSRPARGRWNDQNTAAFLASLRRQHPANSAADRARASVALSRIREESNIERLTAMGEELGLCGSSPRPLRGFPSLGR